LCAQQKRAENASLCATDRRETQIERVEWLSPFEKWIDSSETAARRPLDFKD
jgi:hypothetical protein